MKILVTGIIALGLTVWPIILVQWVSHIQRSNVHATSFPWNDVVPYTIISVLAGFIVTICGTMSSDDEAAFTLRTFGRVLCIFTFCIEGAIVVWYISGVSQFSHFCIN